MARLIELKQTAPERFLARFDTGEEVRTTLAVVTDFHLRSGKELTSPELDALRAASERSRCRQRALRIIGAHFPLAGFSIIAASACQALGKPIYSLINSVCRQIVVLLPVAYGLSMTGRLELVWLAFPIAELVAVVLNSCFLKRTYQASLEKK